jgi:ubiquinone/menaquinone biosynthesis C-methylase UbiE
MGYSLNFFIEKRMVFASRIHRSPRRILMLQKSEASSKPLGTREWYDFVGQFAETFPGIHMGGVEATRRLLMMCNVDKRKKILDVGCGAGYTACLIAEQYGARVIGIDISKVMIEKANQRAQQMGLVDRVEFRSADAYQLPFEDDAFDIVLIESVLTPLPGDKYQALQEMIRVLRPGGWIGANESTVDPESPPELLDAMAKHPATYGYFTAQGLRELFEAAGLQQIQLKETSNVATPSPLKEMGCGGLLTFVFRTYPKIILTLIRDARFREASRIDSQITKRSKDHMSYTLIVGQVSGS